MFVAGKSVYAESSISESTMDRLTQSMASSVSSNFKTDSEQLLDKADIDEYIVSLFDIILN